MSQFTIITHPYVYLVFISLHVLSGQGLTGLFYWLRFGKSPVIFYHKKHQNRHNFISRLMSLPVLIWFISICFYVFSTNFRESILGWPFISINPYYGWFVASIGLIGMLLCQYQMGEAFRVGQEPEDQQSQNSLNTKGCFSYSRNPIYFFSILYLLGISLWVLIWPMWLALFIIIALIHFLVLEEEAFLAQRFGMAYLNYQMTVPRYVGFTQIFRVIYER